MSGKDMEADTKSEIITPNESPTFPEGGREAWRTVIGAALVQFSTFGYTNAFGVYQGLWPMPLAFSQPASDYYVRSYLTNYSPSSIGWIGGVQLFLIFASGIFTGRAFDRGYFHYLMIGGALLHSFSFFMLSLSHQNQYYQVFLSEGIGGGLATGILYVPSLSITSHYFRRNRSLAMGFVAGGAAAGAVIHPIMLNKLFHGSVGFHNGVRISAGMNTVILGVANILMRTRLPPRNAGSGFPLMDFLREPPYLYTVFGGVLEMWGLFFPVFFLQLDAISHGVDRQLAFYCLSILNAASVFGRIVPTLIVPKLGVFNLIIPFTFAMGVLIFSLLGVHSAGGFIAFAAVFGFCSGGGITLIPAMIASLAKDMSEIGSRLGIAFAISALIGLFSTPVAGALLTSQFHWWRPIVFNGTTMVAGAAFFAISRFLVVREKRTQFV